MRSHWPMEVNASSSSPRRTSPTLGFVLLMLLLLRSASEAHASPTFEDPETGDCDKDWEPRGTDDEEIRSAGDFAGYVHSTQENQDYKDVLVDVEKAYVKPCRFPRYNLTGVYGRSNCKVDDIDTLDCEVADDEVLRKCKVYVWNKPRYGGQLGEYSCVEL